MNGGPNILRGDCLLDGVGLLHGGQSIVAPRRCGPGGFVPRSAANFDAQFRGLTGYREAMGSLDVCPGSPP